jgi:hypothetical protein
MFNIVENCSLIAVDVLTILSVYLNIENLWVYGHNQWLRLTVLFVWLQKRVKVQKELTFQDLYQSQELFDEDDEEDDDWDPTQLQKCLEVIKWFCKNCTMDNLNNDVCCQVCL